MPFAQILSMLQACEGPNPVFPPTELYQEKWVIRLVLSWFAGHPGCHDTLQLAEGARWFSEGYLPSAFLARPEVGRKDPLAEAWSRGDGIVGHFAVGSRGKTDVSIAPQASQFNVFEAKIYSRLSPRVSKAPYYDQAARNVACIAEALSRVPRHPAEFRELGFYVLAPRAQIEKGLFTTPMQKESIRQKVLRRAGEYGGARDAWFHDWFEPTLDRIQVECHNWESILDTIRRVDAEGGEVLSRFYGRCLEFCAAKKDREVGADEDGEDAEG
jgi:hypothetical protein